MLNVKSGLKNKILDILLKTIIITIGLAGEYIIAGDIYRVTIF